ncbi:MAG: phosphoserine phosphatase SerB [Rhodospirillaceae bacterium]|jgi:phosphoserine phosphatase|nr:phosphoserine phosphatase SerB [Rhodospirillaceae bacterium]MBT5243136.1 phosphoserine phosphatase SerB [Rhodospirillaceae bacterium]MBT5563361.1 phosphoserine phosphatase SerB [Rhodospirillaceae bacterium]MBT6243675.1 phosphoserine phosphatase SerB [Rhodospirillaceae bacterium]
MTSHALTLIGNAETNPLKTAHIERVCQRLEIPVDPHWLAEDEACDLFMDSPLTSLEVTQQVRESLSGTAIDAACTATRGRRKKLLISDMDSTVIDQECIDELGDAFGVGPQIREITTAVIKGEINFSEALRKRMLLMKGMDQHLLESVYRDRLTIKAGARTLVQTMSHHGAYCILVSGGFSFFTSRISERLGFDDDKGNELIFEDGILTGAVEEPVLGRIAKLTILNELCDQKGLQLAEVLAVGDGANDIMMIQAAGLGVAIHASESLKEVADAFIDHGDLSALLYIQGFHKSQFVTS